MNQDSYWVTGIHAVSEVIRRRSEAIQRLLIKSGRDDQRLNELRELAQSSNMQWEEVDDEALAAVAEDTHQGVAALLNQQKSLFSEKSLLSYLDTLSHPPLLLILDGVTDPHNLGACLRTADAAGVDAVVIPKDKSVGLNATVSRVASGAAETVNLAVVTNLARCLQALKDRNVWIAGTDNQADTSLFEQDLTGPLALVMGSEGAGMRRLTKEKCDFLVSIPMAGELSSLNVSVATGVALFEAVRSRQKS